MTKRRKKFRILKNNLIKDQFCWQKKNKMHMGFHISFHIIYSAVVASLRCWTRSRRLSSCSLEHLIRNSFFSSSCTTISSHLDCLLMSSSWMLGNEDRTNIRPTDENTRLQINLNVRIVSKTGGSCDHHIPRFLGHLWHFLVGDVILLLGCLQQVDLHFNHFQLFWCFDFVHLHFGECLWRF